MGEQQTCRVVRGGGTYEGRQGLTYFAGISADSVGAHGLCMHLLRLPPGARAKAHKHEGHETAIYALGGTSRMWWGEALEHHAELSIEPDLAGAVDELKMIERQRAFSRQVFNQAVEAYNAAIRQFPTRVLMSFVGFSEARSL